VPAADPAPDIVSYGHNGELLWTNSTTNVRYTVEWAPNLAGSWRADWSDLQDIVATSHTMSAEVPMFFRVSSATPAVVTNLFIPDYANLAGRWEYLSIPTNGPTYAWVLEVKRTEQRNGYRVYRIQEFDEFGGRNDVDYWGGDLTEGLYRVGGVNHGAPPEEWFFNPPVPLLLGRFTPGGVYTGRFSHSTAGLSADWALTISNDAVTVTAGTFAEAWKATLTFTLGPQHLTWQYWWAEHVGNVKRIQEDGTVWDLIRYTEVGDP
jgi:hypothetical protein